MDKLLMQLVLLRKLDSLLKPGATLVVMTKRVIDKAAFTQWHYKRDLTHICFYSIETFKWIADNYTRSTWRCRIQWEFNGL
ncbi:methyltransferase domain-containing protein [Shewanella piezotolerans]|uniref:methyltransferase domain-containing protein n=1 Tax=Shewanella piezotolerans TaxID=404011 RepID=UPI0002E1EF14